MAFFLRRWGAMLLLPLVALPFAGTGACGSRTACFEYTQGEYAVHGNSCPAQADALANFTDATCPGPVVSVDGPGSFDGELCCYPVTQDDIVPNCGMGAGGSTMTDPCAFGGCTDTTTDTLTDSSTDTFSDTGTGIGTCGPTCVGSPGTELEFAL